MNEDEEEEEEEEEAINALCTMPLPHALRVCQSLEAQRMSRAIQAGRIFRTDTA